MSEENVNGLVISLSDIKRYYKYWFRGGILGSLLLGILSLFALGTHDPTSCGPFYCEVNIFEQILFFVLSPLFILEPVFDQKLVPYTIEIIIVLIWGFLLGAIIGMTFALFKKHKNNVPHNEMKE